MIASKGSLEDARLGSGKLGGPEHREPAPFRGQRWDVAGHGQGIQPRCCPVWRGRCAPRSLKSPNSNRRAPRHLWTRDRERAAHKRPSGLREAGALNKGRLSKQPQRHPDNRKTFFLNVQKHLASRSETHRGKFQHTSQSPSAPAASAACPAPSPGSGIWERKCPLWPAGA